MLSILQKVGIYILAKTTIFFSSKNQVFSLFWSALVLTLYGTLKPYFTKKVNILHGESVPKRMIGTLIDQTKTDK